jgi:hypothetical protein
MKWLSAAVALSSGASFAGPCSEQITALQQSMSSRDAGAGPLATGSAASAQDVRLQQQGQPTQAEAAQHGTPAAAVGEDKLQKVAADLDRARSLDGKNDSGCIGAVNDARKDMATD